MIKNSVNTAVRVQAEQRDSPVLVPTAADAEQMPLATIKVGPDRMRKTAAEQAPVMSNEMIPRIDNPTASTESPIGSLPRSREWRGHEEGILHTLGPEVLSVRVRSNTEAIRQLNSVAPCD